VVNGADPTLPVALLQDYLLVSIFGPTPDTCNFRIDGLGSAPTIDLYQYYTQGIPGNVSVDGTQPNPLVPAPFSPTGIFTTSNTRYFPAITVTGGSITGTFFSPPGTPGLISGMTIVTPLPAAPSLSIARQNNQVVISWTGTATLQSADSVLGPWTDIRGATSGQAIAPSAARMFYRLSQ
jgi:hypothetical protein